VHAGDHIPRASSPPDDDAASEGARGGLGFELHGHSDSVGPAGLKPAVPVGSGLVSLTRGPLPGPVYSPGGRHELTTGPARSSTTSIHRFPYLTLMITSVPADPDKWVRHARTRVPVTPPDCLPS